MLAVAAILLVWVITFLIALLPARRIAHWIVGTGANFFYSAIFCVMFTKLFILSVLAILLFSPRLSFLPHVYADPKGFGLFLIATLFFVPVFSALILGVHRVRTFATV